MTRSDRLMADLVTATDAAPRMRLMLEICVGAAIVLFLILFATCQRERIFARVQATEAFTIWLPARVDLLTWRAERGVWPEPGGEISSEALAVEVIGNANLPGNITRAVELGEDGVVTVIFGDEAPVEGLRGRRLSFRPAVPTATPGAPVIWFCGSHPVPAGFEPGGRDLSDLDPAYLPSPCKDFPRP